MTVNAISARKPNIDLAKIDATTEEDVRRQLREKCNAPDKTIRNDDINLPAVIRKRLGMSQR